MGARVDIQDKDCVAVLLRVFVDDCVGVCVDVCNEDCVAVLLGVCVDVCEADNDGVDMGEMKIRGLKYVAILHMISATCTCSAGPKHKSLSSQSHGG